MICKASQDEAIHQDSLDNQDDKALAIENLAEDLMQNAETGICYALRQPKYNFNMTRADINKLCSTDEFNNLFYAMAEKLINRGHHGSN